ARDLGAQVVVARELRDPVVLPAALRLALGRDAAEQLVGRVVVADLVIDRARRKHLLPPLTVGRAMLSARAFRLQFSAGSGPAVIGWAANPEPPVLLIAGTIRIDPT